MAQRRYVLKERARAQEETRQKIAAAAAELHEAVGPKATTITAVAERAGVQRLTVYRHFPDDKQLFEACTAHWLALNPLPEATAWLDAAGPERCRKALLALYGYYRRTERMWDVSHRDEPDVPALQGPMNDFRRYLAAIRDDLLESFAPPRQRRKQVQAVLGHAVGFTTWQSLARQGLSDAQMAEIIVTWVGAVLNRAV